MNACNNGLCIAHPWPSRRRCARKRLLHNLPDHLLLGAASGLLCMVLGTTALGAVASDTNVLVQMTLNGATNELFAAVGRVYVYSDVQNNQGDAGTGQLITPSWVLTAGHVLTYITNSGSVLQEIVFRMGPDANNPLLAVVADSWLIYPGYSGSGTGSGHDLALIHLSQAVPSITPVTLYHGRMAALTGQVAEMVGYGRPCIAGQGLLPTDRIRRAGQNIIGDCAYPSFVGADYVCCIYSPTNDPTCQPLEWSSSPGDSGGGWFVFMDGKWQLAAVTSGVATYLEYTFGDVTYAYFVGAQLDWIYGVIGVVPSLAIQQTDASTVEVQWPSWATSYVLQTGTDLTGTNWATSAAQIADDGTTKSVTVSAAGNAQQFWRLARQASAGARAAKAPRAPPPPGSYDDLLDRTP